MELDFMVGDGSLNKTSTETLDYFAERAMGKLAE